MSLHFEGGIRSLGIESRAVNTLALNLPLLGIALVMVSARILVNAKVRRLATEDVFIVLGALFTTSLVMMTVAACKFGFGSHSWDLRPEWWSRYGKFNYVIMVIGSLPFFFTKGSMLFFYLRLAPHPRFRILCYICIGYISLTVTFLTLANTFGCTPISGGWNSDPYVHPKCIHVGLFYYFAQGNNALLDILLMILPIPILMRLNLGLRVKLGLVVMFTSGFLITAVSGFSLHALYCALHSPDPLWDGAYSWMWSMAEMSVGIITACMPSMMLVAQWLRGDVTLGNSNGTPDVEMGENVTIGGGGGGGGGGRRRQHEHGLGSADLHSTINHDNGDDQSDGYRMTGIGGIEKSTEVLVETGMAPQSSG